MFKQMMTGLALAGLLVGTTCLAQPAPDVHISYPLGRTVRQGNILEVAVAKAPPQVGGITATWDSRTTPLFPQTDGSWSGLVGVPVDTKPGPHTLRLRNSGGETLALQTIQVLDAHYGRQNIVTSKKTAGIQPIPGELAAVQALKEDITPARLWDKPLQSPTPGCEESPFGVRRFHNGVYIQDYHKGVDLKSPFGTPIHAVAGGKIMIARPDFALHGQTVGIDHGQGLTSIYIHMSKILVHQGDVVEKGQVIGKVGSTGFSTGPHLHWGLYVNGVPVNPDPWIPVVHCG